ncbi:MAG: hypothetical protein GX945_06500 [Lentisphaerae bacterium]|jgi:endonuclease-3 related protein|nr:hypothetical protein [Lentisphaerota bacterium]
MSATSILTLYERLYAHYGPQHWWPRRYGGNWEIVAGALLTQNCAWRNVERALANLYAAGVDSADAVLSTPLPALQELIRPAGFFRQKSAYLHSLAAFYLKHGEEYATACSAAELQRRRRELLALRGVGRETADSILLYAFTQPIFVIDAYTRRVSERHLGIADAVSRRYDDLQAQFMAALPKDTQLYNEYHALLVQFCKDSCLKKGCGALCATLAGGEGGVEAGETDSVNCCAAARHAAKNRC